jgi:hypothetical protein
LRMTELFSMKPFSADRNWWTQYWAHSAGRRNTFNQGQGHSAYKHLQMRFHQS